MDLASVVGFLWWGLAAAAVWGAASSGLLRDLVRRISKVDFGVASLGFTPEAASAAKLSLNETVGGAKANVDSFLQVQASERAIRSKFEKFLGVDKPVLEGRATIHLVDPLLKDTLYQLVHYIRFPEDGGTVSGASRRFSQRTGLIGLAARTGEPQFRVDYDQIEEAELVEKWGMTKDEAARHVTAHPRVMAAIPLVHEESGELIAVLYLDDSKRSGRGASSQLRRGELPEEWNTRTKIEVTEWCDRLKKKYELHYTMRTALQQVHDGTAGRRPHLNVSNF